MLKSCGCDAMTGAGGSFLGRGSESKERNGLGQVCFGSSRAARQIKQKHVRGPKDNKILCTTKVGFASESARVPLPLIASGSVYGLGAWSPLDTVFDCS